MFSNRLTKKPFFILILLAGLFWAQGVDAQVWFNKAMDETDPNLKVEYLTRAIKEERQDRWVYYQRAWAYSYLDKLETALKDVAFARKAEGRLDDTHLDALEAWFLYRLDDYQAGIEAAERSIAADPDNLLALNAKGWCLLGLDRDAEAVQSFSKYVQAQPEDPIGYKNRSYAYAQAGQYQNVIADCDKVISMGASNDFIIERKAYAMMKLGQKDAAIALVKDKIDYKPNDPISLSQIGNLFHRNEDYDAAIKYHTEAIATYNRIVREDKDFRKEFRDNIFEIYISRGEAHYDKKDYQLALADFKEASSIKAEDYRAWLKIGQLQTYQENWLEGADGYEQAFSRNPDLKFGWVNLGFCYGQLNQPGKAIDAYTRGIRNNPDVGLLYNNRGFNYLELKQYDKALADLQKAIEVEPEIVMSHVSLGEYYYDVKDYDKAIAKFDEALAMEEGSDQAYTAAHFTRGRSYFDMEQWEKAGADFKAAIKITPDHVEAHEFLGIVYFNTDQKCEAYKILKRTLDLEKMVPPSKKKATKAPLYLGKLTRNPCI